MKRFFSECVYSRVAFRKKQQNKGTRDIKNGKREGMEEEEGGGGKGKVEEREAGGEGKEWIICIINYLVWCRLGADGGRLQEKKLDVCK